MSKYYSLKDVAEHSSPDSPWFIIGQKVYNVTKLLDQVSTVDCLVWPDISFWIILAFAVFHDCCVINLCHLTAIGIHHNVSESYYPLFCAYFYPACVSLLVMGALAIAQSSETKYIERLHCCRRVFKCNLAPLKQLFNQSVNSILREGGQYVFTWSDQSVCHYFNLRHMLLKSHNQWAVT